MLCRPPDTADSTTTRILSESKDSKDFINFIEHTKLAKNTILASNIPQEEGITSVCKVYETSIKTVYQSLLSS